MDQTLTITRAADPHLNAFAHRTGVSDVTLQELGFDQVLRIHDFVTGALLRQALGPRLEALLQDHGVTAWVAANDVTGLVCLDTLQRNRIRMPGHLSLLSFDDTREALARRLSSYNFNVHGLVGAMLTAILHPALKREAGSKTIEVDGFVNERGTCGEARG